MGMAGVSCIMMIINTKNGTPTTMTTMHRDGRPMMDIIYIWTASLPACSGKEKGGIERTNNRTDR